MSKYDRLARRYDRRWASYLHASLGHTLAQIQLRDGQTVLDVGCGTGQLLATLAATTPAATFIGVDASREMLRVAQSRVQRGRFIRGAAEQLPIASGSVDWLVTTSVFHYVSDPFAARREFRRVLSPGGTLVLTDWSADYLTTRLLARWSRVFDPDIRHVYTPIELQAIFGAAGFDVKVENYEVGRGWGLMTMKATRS